MKPILYLLKTYPINITNLFLGSICSADQHRILDPCQYSIAPGGFFQLILGDIGKKMIESPELTFRHIDWSQSIYRSRLDELIDQAIVENKILCFGNHHTDQLEFLKSHYGDRCFTVGMTYDENLYPTLLDNMAKYHVYMLKNNLIQPNNDDLDKMKNLSDIDLVIHYRDWFDQMKLIARSSQVNLDYNFSISDFFDLKKLENHYINLGFQNTEKFREYYSIWQLSK